MAVALVLELLGLSSNALAQTLAPQPSASPVQQAPSAGVLASIVRVRTLPAVLSEADRAKAIAIVTLLKKGADAEARAKLFELSGDLSKRGVSRAAQGDVASYLARRGLLDTAPHLLLTVDALRFALDKQGELAAQAQRLTVALTKLASGGTAKVQLVALRPTFSLDAGAVAGREEQTLDQASLKSRLKETEAVIAGTESESEDARDRVEEAREQTKALIERLREWLEARDHMLGRVQI